MSGITLNLLGASFGGGAAGAIAVAHATTPFITAYPWSEAGFGTKYANPATLPTGTGNSVAFSPDGASIAVAHATTPFVTAYPWSTASGFGTKYANPTTLPGGVGIGLAFSSSGESIVVSQFSSPFVVAYPWSSTSGFGTKYANPSPLPASFSNCAAFTPDDSAVVLGLADTFPINITLAAYAWSSSGFGTQYANPSPLPKEVYGVAFSPDGSAVAIAHFDSPFCTVYAWSTASGFGTKYANPTTLPGSAGTAAHSVAFTPDGLAIAVTSSVSPRIYAYPWSTASGFGTKYADPTTLPTGSGNGVAFSSDGLSIAVAHATTPFVTAYPWSTASGFGTKYANPAVLPTDTGYAVAFTPAPL